VDAVEGVAEFFWQGVGCGDGVVLTCDTLVRTWTLADSVRSVAPFVSVGPGTDGRHGWAVKISRWLAMKSAQVVVTSQQPGVASERTHRSGWVLNG
jgi:hypothetical protein